MNKKNKKINSMKSANNALASVQSRNQSNDTEEGNDEMVKAEKPSKLSTMLSEVDVNPDDVILLFLSVPPNMPASRQSMWIKQIKDSLPKSKFYDQLVIMPQRGIEKSEILVLHIK